MSSVLHAIRESHQEWSMTGARVDIPVQKIIRMWFIVQIVMVIIMKIYIYPPRTSAVAVMLINTISLLVKNGLAFPVIR